jgi:hypothetical protein
VYLPCRHGRYLTDQFENKTSIVFWARLRIKKYTNKLGVGVHLHDSYFKPEDGRYSIFNDRNNPPKKPKEAKWRMRITEA